MGFEPIPSPVSQGAVQTLYLPRTVPNRRIELLTLDSSDPRSTNELNRRGREPETRTLNLLGVDEML
jgi:hypothetical protein